MTQEKINIAELLKDCPQGMELDSTMYDNLYFDSLDADYNGIIICYTLIAGTKTSISFTKYGTFNNHMGAKCVIFPKGKTTWEGFQRPFKDGDILTYNSTVGTSIFIHRNKKGEHTYKTSFYVGFNVNDRDKLLVYNKYTLIALNGDSDVRFATEEEKQELFDAIKENGYKWNAETKTLEKLTIPKFKVGDVIINIYRKYLNCDSKGGKISKIIDDKYIFDTGSYTHIQCQDNYELVSNKLVEPKFKVGDKIVQKNSACTTILITNVGDEFYYSNTEGSVGVLPISEQDDWELVSNKFDINTLVPFESKVLIRDGNTDKWKPNFWGFYNSEIANNYPYECCGDAYCQCIPYEGNEHLLGKKDDCDEYFKNW